MALIGEVYVGDILGKVVLDPRGEDDLSEDVADVHLTDERHLPFPLCAPFHKHSCAASEDGAPFVARRAVNLHGCALPHFAPPPTAAPPDLPLVRAPSVLSSRYVTVFMD